MLGSIMKNESRDADGASALRVDLKLVLLKLKKILAFFSDLGKNT
jgi:hypothetical protein